MGRMSSVRTRWSKTGRLVAGLAATAVMVCFLACGENPPISGDGRINGPGTPSSCATPQQGCPCTPGSVVACGKHVNTDDNFIYCYQGNRYCEPSGVYGDCIEGSIVSKSTSSSIHTPGLGTSAACSGGETGPLLVCSGGKRQGDFCTTNADCSPGKKKCAAGPDDGKNCRDDSECSDPGLCAQFNGECNGGTRDHKGCDTAGDAPAAHARSILVPARGSARSTSDSAKRERTRVRPATATQTAAARIASEATERASEGRRTRRSAGTTISARAAPAPARTPARPPRSIPATPTAT
jgi:hypothetical protein